MNGAFYKSQAKFLKKLKKDYNKKVKLVDELNETLSLPQERTTIDRSLMRDRKMFCFAYTNGIKSFTSSNGSYCSPKMRQMQRE